MEELFVKMKEYLNMDSELPYEEFAAYYQQFVNFLNAKYDELDQDTRLKARFIASVLAGNSEDRAKHKGPTAKKFKKMEEKSRFWVNAIDYKLQKEGMTKESIDEATAAISDAM